MTRQETRQLSIPLGRTAHELAMQYAAQQASAIEGRQVYLNTLAVYAVQSWLEWMHIESDWPASISWQASLQGLMGAADLWISNRGRLMCQAVVSGASVIDIPGMGTDTLGCVVVQFEDVLDQAIILGFTESIQVDDEVEIPLTNLKPLSYLLSQLHREHASIDSQAIDLRGWLSGIFDQGWQSLENLLGPSDGEWSLAYRSQERLAAGSLLQMVKRIDGQGQLAGQSFLLMVAVTPITDTVAASNDGYKTEVNVQLHPELGQSYLPPGIQLALFSEEQTCIQQTAARVQDNFIQLLPFRCLYREGFSLQVMLEDVWVTETFQG